MALRTAIFCTLLPLFCAAARGQITLSQDFDSGSLNVPATTIAGNTINLVGRQTWTASVYSSFYRWIYFRADGVLGQQPTFSIPTGNFLGSYTNHRYVYSYDQQNWSFFESGSTASGKYNFSSAAPFAQNSVYVAYGLPYPVSRTAGLAAQVSTSVFGHATPSETGGLSIGQSAAGIDDSGRAVAPQDIHAYRISDDGFAATKRKVVLAAGNHAAETPGDFVLEGIVRFLLSADPRAAGLRRSADFYVYPQVNPSGRFAGYYRSNPENPSEDYNRHWNDPEGFTDLSQITAAMRADTGGDVDYLIDMHSWWGPWTADNYINVTAAQSGNPFFSHLAAREPAIGVVQSSGESGMLRVWGSSPAGLKADLAITPEFGFFPNVGESRLFEYGRNFALALYDSIPINVLPGDFDDDGVVAIGDFSILGSNFGQNVTGVQFGDANGDLIVDLSDFAILASNWMSGAGGIPEGLGRAAVPEPASAAMVFAIGLSLVTCRSRRPVISA